MENRIAYSIKLTTKIRKTAFLFAMMMPSLWGTSQDVNPFMSTEFLQITRMEYNLRTESPEAKNRLFCDQWCEGKVITRLDTLTLKFNYDLSDEFFFINMNEKVFTIKSDFIVGFVMGDRSFMSYRGYQDEEVLILESMVSGKFALYQHHGLKYKAPDFDPILNIGKKEPSYKRTSAFYAFCANKLLKVSSKPKKALKTLVKECKAPKSLKLKGDVIGLFRSLNKTE